MSTKIVCISCGNPVGITEQFVLSECESQAAEERCFEMVVSSMTSKF